MHITWIGFTIVTLLAWGSAGVLGKLSTNRMPAESLMVLAVLGTLAIQPLVFPHESLSIYSHRAIAFGLLSGLLSTMGGWGYFEAMRVGGSASIVTVITALYPLPVVLLAPLVLHEYITRLQSVGIACAIIAVILLTLPSKVEKGNTQIAVEVDGSELVLKEDSVL